MVRQECVHVMAQMIHDQLRQVGREHNLETLFGNIPAHDVFRLRIEDGSRVQDFRPRIFSFRARHDGRGGAIAKQRRGNQIGHGNVFLLQSQRTELHGKQRRNVMGKGAHVIRGAGDSGRSRHATQTKNGNALDAGRHAHAIHQARIKRGTGDTRDRDHEQGIDILGAKPTPAKARQSACWPSSCAHSIQASLASPQVVIS